MSSYFSIFKLHLSSIYQLSLYIIYICIYLYHLTLSFYHLWSIFIYLLSTYLIHVSSKCLSIFNIYLIYCPFIQQYNHIIFLISSYLATYHPSISIYLSSSSTSLSLPSSVLQIPECICRGQRTIFRIQFSPSAVWAQTQVQVIRLGGKYLYPIILLTQGHTFKMLILNGIARNKGSIA